MAPPTDAKACRPVVVKRSRPRASILGLAAAALALASSSTSTAFAGLRLAGGRDDTAVARAAAARPAPEKFGDALYNSYEGFVYRKKTQEGMHMKMQRGGRAHAPYYRIMVQPARKMGTRTKRWIERIGWHNPMRITGEKNFFALRCDRAVYWLRAGAQPTDAVANLLDRAGIIRRTGPNAKLGEWEWRVPKNSGPDAPEGWEYNGPHSVTWNNRPRHVKKKNGRSASVKRLPLIERFGFTGYKKIPIDQEVITDPIAGTALSNNFPNTELPPM